MFRPRTPSSNIGLQQASPDLVSRRLLYVLAPGQSVQDYMTNHLQQPRQVALQGQTDVSTQRAELDLRKAMRLLVLGSPHANIASLSTLTALSLPDATATWLWLIAAFLEHQYQKSDSDHFVRQRDHDARLLFQKLAQVDLIPWFTHSVDKVTADAILTGLQFPQGHPTPGQLYRKHPFKAKHHCYYPAVNYFSMLFHEREQAMLALLSNLGATKIVIEQMAGVHPPSDQTHKPKVFEYAYRDQSQPSSIDPQHYPWLAYEPTWQSVVNERMKRGLSLAQFELDYDVMGLLRAQIEIICQFIPELDSMVLSDQDQAALQTKILQPHQVTVEFRPF